MTTMMHDVNEDSEDFYDAYLENMEHMEPEQQFSSIDQNDKLRVETSTIRWASKNKCGLKNITIPNKNTVLNINSK